MKNTDEKITIKKETLERAVRLLIELYAEQNGVDVVITEKKSIEKKPTDK